MKRNFKSCRFYVPANGRSLLLFGLKRLLAVGVYPKGVIGLRIASTHQPSLLKSTAIYNLCVLYGRQGSNLQLAGCDAF